jgi:hypothetical protein
MGHISPPTGDRLLSLCADGTSVPNHSNDGILYVCIAHAHSRALSRIVYFRLRLPPPLSLSPRHSGSNRCSALTVRSP